MIRKFQKFKNGYIIITTSIILMIVLLAISLVLALGVFLSRSSSLDFISKKSSFFLARTCQEQALLRLANNSSYLGNETLNFSWGSCQILPLESSGNLKIIKTKAAVNTINTNFKYIINSADLTPVSLEEVASF